MAFVAGSFGGGDDTEGMYIGMIEHGEPAPNVILMADTGGEKPNTYDNIPIFSAYLVAHGYPPITMVYNKKRDGSRGVLETELLRLNQLPSVAYGFKTCSQRFKVRPQENFLKLLPEVQAEWRAGRKVVKLIGYNADELGRAKYGIEPLWERRYPLIEWRWGKKDCIAAIQRAGLPRPGKSACFFCPNSKKHEISKLNCDHPKLIARAILLEDRARASGNMEKVKGLGRRFSWKDFLNDEKRTRIHELDLFDQTIQDDEEAENDQVCACVDG